MQNQYRICNPVLILQSGKAVLRETPASWVRTLIDITQLLSPARRYAATVIERKLPLRYRTGFNHERREPSVPRRGRCKSTVSFAGCLSPGKDGSLLLISWLFPFPDASFPEVRASLLRCGTKRKSIASGTEADDLRSMDKGNFPKTFFFQMFMLDSGLLIRCMVFSMF